MRSIKNEKGIRIQGIPDILIKSVEFYTDTRNKDHIYKPPPRRSLERLERYDKSGGVL